MQKQLLSLLLAGAVMLPAWGVPARRGYYEKTDINGQAVRVQRVGDEFGHYWEDANGQKYTVNEDSRLVPATEQTVQALKSRANARRAARRIPGNVGKFPGSTFPCKGKQKAIVILVEYKDCKFKIGDDARAKQYFTDMLNKDGFSEYNGTGSVHEYFIDSSNGQFDCQFDLFGPITLKNKRSYYGGNDFYGDDKAPEEMVIEACKALDSEVNFKGYDRDNDGYVDNIYVIYAGEGEASSDVEDSVWPHSWSLSEADATFKLDGVTIDTYGCSNEWEIYSNNGKGGPDGIGTFVHEFSHVMGLPDLYHTEDQSVTYTPGSWSVLDYGPYNNDGRTPPAYGAFERNAMGWIDLTELTADAGDLFLSDINYANEAYSITSPTNSQEFYLIEARQQKGWDKYLPGEGMLIWHVDYDSGTWGNNAVNNLQRHQGVDLIEADGKTSKEERDSGDCFPGKSKVTSYSPKWWSGNSVGLDLSNIAVTSDGGVMFTVSQNIGAGNNPGGEVGGDFYTVSDVLNGGAPSNSVVRGYIIGWANNWNDKGVYFTASNCKSGTNILMADDSDERDRDYIIPVQLPDGNVRKELNLLDNPTNLGRYVEVTGKVTSYFGTIGIKETTSYRFISNAESGLIEEVSTASPKVDSQTVYDLQGRPVANPRAGQLYIRGGKLFRNQ
ncbi:MAG: M6 family metalloprotease domain-containing protein [Bacteroides sp.]|nr:M6 family metalloprotease domain-containing protein [Bacteroides sp.]MCM1379404.1 M6 family metalloprotease domain-containing protein [Bacteroides sp.]MCM1445264.1 M6 family metalloprotease domain-containing protein [Prevotella sp.]